MQKTSISDPSIRTRTCAYQRVKNISFSENFAYVLNGWTLTNNDEAEDFDNTFSAPIGARLFIPPRQRGFQNLLDLNIQRGRDNGLQSHTAYRKLRGIPNAKHRGSNPFSIFQNTISNPEILKDLNGEPMEVLIITLTCLLQVSKKQMTVQNYMDVLLDAY